MEKRFYYLLRTTQAFDNVDLTIEEAEILFFHSHIIVNNLKENQSFLFKVDSHPLTEIAHQMTFDNVIEGFGLGWYEGNPLETNDDAAVNRQIIPIIILLIPPDCECIGPAVFPPPFCNFGGPGTSSCSINLGGNLNCSVTCGAGLYSCCN